MKTVAWMVLFLALGALTGNTGVWAQEEDGDEVDVADDEPQAAAEGEYEEEEYDDEEDVSGDVATSYFFPDNPDKRLSAGKEITVLVGFTNNGAEAFNVTRVGAYLHSPFDFNYYIQNFTAREVTGLAGPGQQISLEYTFIPDPSLEPLEFWLSGYVEFMGDDDRVHRTTFVNGTVDLVEEKKTLDFQQIFHYFLVIGGVGALAYMGMNAAQKKGLVPRKKRGPPTEIADAEWDVDTYKPSEKSRSANNRRKKVVKK